MQQITLNIEDQYLNPFLTYLKDLNYVEIKAISKKKKVESKLSASELFLKNAHPDDPIVKVVKPINKIITIEEMIAKQGYKGIDRQNFNSIVKRIDFKELSIEEIIEQLNP
jgi:hypothetical protein